jgi:hypothetical protein
MKTDRFDEEFRRKLRGLPANADPGEVERIQEYVRANQPGSAGFSWRRLILYGGSSLFLMASLTYHFIQNDRNHRLQSSLDSLTHQSVVRAHSQAMLQPDPVYRTRNGPKETVVPAASLHPEIQAALPGKKFSSPATEPYWAGPTVQRGQADPVLAKYGRFRSAWQSVVPEDIETARPGSTERVTSKSPQQIRQWSPAEDTSRLLGAAYSLKLPQAGTSNSPARFAPERTVNRNWGASSAEQAGLLDAIELLTNWRPIQRRNQMAVLVPGQSVVLTRDLRSTKSADPRRIRPDGLETHAPYRLGGGLTVGANQLGASLVGEYRLNRHWSVQAGLRLLYMPGFHYGDEQDFEQHLQKDFRSTYAPAIPRSSDIHDIHQVTLLVQLPLQVAYQYPVGRQWGIRGGLGTDLDLWARSMIRYEFRERSRSSEGGRVQVEESVTLFNNLTLSTAVERPWGRWILRAGPFISPKLRTVSYQPEGLRWGVNFQILYGLGK